MDTTEIFVAIGLAVFATFGCFAILFFDEMRTDLNWIRSYNERILDRLGELRQVRMTDGRPMTIEEYEEFKKMFGFDPREDTQPEKATPEVEDVSHYSEQSVDPQAARSALETAWCEFVHKYGGKIVAAEKASPEQSWPEVDEGEVSLGDQYPDGTKLSDMIADREARRVADQPAAQLVHCSCIWDIVWTPQTMARPGDKMEGREGIVQYDRDCLVHGHNSPDNRREDQ